MREVSVVACRTDRASTADEVVRAELARRCGRRPRDVVVGRRCPRCGSSHHGRPVTDAGLDLAISRARGLTLVAVSDAGPVGVDVEPARAASFEGFDAVALHPGERAADDLERTRLWVRKEAVLKATGAGLRTDPREVGVDTDRVVLAGSSTAWLRDIPWDGYAVAVAVLAEAAPVVSVREVPEAVADAATR